MEKSAENKEKGKKPALEIVSNSLSAVFSPILVPTYAYAIVMWATSMCVIPEKTRFVSSMVIFAISAIIPLGVIMYLIRKGKVSDPAISNPKERLIPYTVTAVCYLLAAFYLSRLPSWLPGFFIGAAIAAMLDALVNLKWKISAHATSMGGLCALIMFLGVQNLAIVMIIPWLSTAFLLSGAVGTARLYLKRHTPAQVYAGFLLGFAVTYLTVTFL